MHLNLLRRDEIEINIVNVITQCVYSARFSLTKANNIRIQNKLNLTPSVKDIMLRDFELFRAQWSHFQRFTAGICELKYCILCTSTKRKLTAEFNSLNNNEILYKRCPSSDLRGLFKIQQNNLISRYYFLKKWSCNTEIYIIYK